MPPTLFLPFSARLIPIHLSWIKADAKSPGLSSMTSSSSLSLFCFTVYFWERERQRDREWAGEGQTERETQNPKQAPGSELSAQSPTRGSNSQTARSWPESKSDTQPNEPPRRPMCFWINLCELFTPTLYRICHDYFLKWLFCRLFFCLSWFWSGRSLSF